MIHILFLGSTIKGLAAIQHRATPRTQSFESIEQTFRVDGDKKECFAFEHQKRMNTWKALAYIGENRKSKPGNNQEVQYKPEQGSRDQLLRNLDSVCTKVRSVIISFGSPML